jgi:hypothetical protein
MFCDEQPREEKRGRNQGAMRGRDIDTTKSKRISASRLLKSHRYLKNKGCTHTSKADHSQVDQRLKRLFSGRSARISSAAKTRGGETLLKKAKRRMDSGSER